MRNLVSSAIEEVLSFKPGNCHACRELHEDLKAALMEYLLSTTNMYVCGQDVAEMRIKRVESKLRDTLAEFHGHRKDTHFLEYFDFSWLEMPQRNAS